MKCSKFYISGTVHTQRDLDQEYLSGGGQYSYQVSCGMPLYLFGSFWFKLAILLDYIGEEGYDSPKML